MSESMWSNDLILWKKYTQIMDSISTSWDQYSILTPDTLENVQLCPN